MAILFFRIGEGIGSMTLCGVVAHSEGADLLKASPFMDVIAHEVGARIRNGGY